jgi:cell division protein ZapA (FtsZ GTPase activity inhibitor)
MREENLEFSILGCRVKLSSIDQQEQIGVEPRAVVEHMLEQVDHMKKKRSDLSDKDIAVLCALNLAEENMKLKNLLQKKMNHLESDLGQTLKMIDQAIAQATV